MRARGRPTRLELHRLSYNRNGRRGSLLTVQDLDDHEKEIVNREVLQDVRVKRIDFTGDMDEQIFDEVQMGVLAEYGVMCLHPEYSLEKSDHPRAKRCGVCGALVAQWGWLAALDHRLKQKR